MSLSDRFYEEYSKILENSTREYIPTKKIYGGIIIFLICGKSYEKYNEQVRKNWKYRFLNILVEILGIKTCFLNFDLLNSAH